MKKLFQNDFLLLSDYRERESQTLCDAGLFSGAYYLAGYAVECAIKAAIASQTEAGEFPDKNYINKIYTHDLETLLKSSILEKEFKKDIGTNAELGANWNEVIPWSEQVRYELNIDEPIARMLLNACFSTPNGVVTWIKSKLNAR